MGLSFLKGTLAILAASLLLQTGLLAQHGNASMSSGHVGGGVHAGPSPSFSGSARYFAPPSGAFAASRYPSFQANRSFRPSRSPYGGSGGVGYRRRYPYFYPGYVGLAPFGYGLPLPYALPYGDDEVDTSAGQPAPQQADYADQPMSDYGLEPPQMAENGQPTPYRPSYQPQSNTVAVNAQPATTLIFRDGRSPVQVRNYALTGSTLYALDGESRQEIPLSLLDIPATVAANRAAGVDFALPVAR